MQTAASVPRSHWWCVEAGLPFKRLLYGALPICPTVTKVPFVPLRAMKGGLAKETVGLLSVPPGPEEQHPDEREIGFGGGCVARGVTRPQTREPLGTLAVVYLV